MAGTAAADAVVGMAAVMEAGDERSHSSSRPSGSAVRGRPRRRCGGTTGRQASGLPDRRCGGRGADRCGPSQRRQGGQGDPRRKLGRLRARRQGRCRPRAARLPRGVGRQARGAVADGNRAIIEVGNEGWTLPIPIVKDGAEWRFDVGGGEKEVLARQLGHDELGAIQTLLAIVDAEFEYVERDPMKTGWPQYARRLLSSPGRKDGLYWPTTAGETPSPLGEEVADLAIRWRRAGQPLRLQLPPALRPGPGGRGRRPRLPGERTPDRRLRRHRLAADLRRDRRHDLHRQLPRRGLSSRTSARRPAERAGAIAAFNPDKGWEKADMTPP